MTGNPRCGVCGKGFDSTDAACTAWIYCDAAACGLDVLIDSLIAKHALNPNCPGLEDDVKVAAGGEKEKT